MPERAGLVVSDTTPARPAPMRPPSQRVRDAIERLRPKIREAKR